MMTYAWTLSLMLDSEFKYDKCSAYTMAYIIKLVLQLTPKQALYAEIRWRDPV